MRLIPGAQGEPAVGFDLPRGLPPASSFADPDTLRTPIPTASSAPRFDRCVLTVLAGDRVGTILPVRDDEVLIGRSTFATLCCNDPSVSRRHARVFRLGAEVYVEDLGSTNGTAVGGRRIRARRPLRDGDRIGIGALLLKVSFEDALEERAALELYECAVHDPVTGAYNRRYLDEQIVAELAFASRHGLPLSALLIDVDQFKQVNDTFGHQVGDAVLRAVADAVYALVRPEDVVARYGGDELVILARETTQDGAVKLAERVRRTVAELDGPYAGLVSVSIGVATCGPPSDVGPHELLAAADRGMYLAKARGRNRVATGSL